MKRNLLILAAASLAACGMQTIGQPPEMTTIGRAEEGAPAILTAERAGLAVPPPQPARYAYQQASLWNTGPTGLLGDRRAKNLGDILTVTIEIDDEAEMKNSTTRSREGSESAEVGGFFGVSNVLPPGLMKLNPNVEMGSQSEYEGDGSVKRNEKLTLRIAATVVQVWAAATFYRAAWASARHGATNMNTLVVVGTSVAYGYSAFVTLWPGLAQRWNLPTHLYFESAVFIVGLVLLGRWLEARAKKQTGAAIKALMGLRAKTARVIRNGREEDVALEAVAK